MNDVMGVRMATKPPKDKIKIAGNEVTINGTTRQLDERGNIAPIIERSGILGQTERVVEYVKRQKLQKKLDRYRAAKALKQAKPG